MHNPNPGPNPNPDPNPNPNPLPLTKVGLVAKLVDIVKGVPKEKVVRVALATLRQLVVSGAGNAASDMVGCGIMKVLGSLQTRKWADEDIVEDIDYLNAALQVNALPLTLTLTPTPTPNPALNPHPRAAGQRRLDELVGHVRQPQP